MFTSAIKKQTDCSFYLNPYMVFQTWNHRIEKKKESNSIFSLYC